MAKGSIAKEEITKKILEVFEGSFLNDKEIRIPFQENGETVQIKVALTCAKVNIECGSAGSAVAAPVIADGNRDITPQEAKEVKDLIETLGL